MNYDELINKYSNLRDSKKHHRDIYDISMTEECEISAEIKLINKFLSDIERIKNSE